MRKAPPLTVSEAAIENQNGLFMLCVSRELYAHFERRGPTGASYYRAASAVSVTLNLKFSSETFHPGESETFDRASPDMSTPVAMAGSRSARRSSTFLRIVSLGPIWR